MKQLLDEAKWMDGAVWTLLMFTVFATIELLLLGAQANAAFWSRQIIVWGLAGAGYAVLSGWLERKRAARDAQTTSAAEPQAAVAAETETPPAGDRAQRRRAAKAARKQQEQGR